MRDSYFINFLPKILLFNQIHKGNNYKGYVIDRTTAYKAWTSK